VAKALKIAAIVVGVAALVATGVGVAIGAGTIIAGLGISVGTLATVLSVTATVLSFAAGALAKPPRLTSGISGQQLDWRADPASGEPYVIGDAMVGASIVHQASWGDKNKFLGMVGVLSVCTITGYDGLYADMTQVNFSGRNATGYFHDFMYLSTQLGAMPEGAALDMTAPDSSNMPDWSAAHKMSGLAAIGLLMVADITNGKIYSGGTPKLTNRIRGVKAYDPRLDSTQTGGSGAQRALTESTYAYSQNPWVHGVTYALGRWQNGKIVIGPGLPADKIDFSAYMEAATIADANGWKASGVISSTDRKWDALKAIAQAGGGWPMPTGAHLSCLVNAPKVSLATITEADVKGSVSAPQMLSRRDRINGAIPRYRSADHGWEIVPGDTIRSSTYLTEDGGTERTREIEFPLVADVGDGAGKDQAAQLAAYEVANSRERTGISVELGYVWSQYKLGDCLTLNIPSANLVSQKAVIIGREINISRNTVTLIFRTETDAKHTWALGVAGTVSAPPDVTQAPGTGDTDGTLEQTQIALNATTTPDLTVSAAESGGSASITFSAFHLRYPGLADVAVSGTTLTGKAPDSHFYLFADVTGIGDAAPTLGATTVRSEAINSPAHPYRVFLNREIDTPASGSGGSSSGSGVIVSTAVSSSFSGTGWTDLTGTQNGTTPSGATSAMLSASLEIENTGGSGTTTFEIQFERQIAGVWTLEGAVQSLALLHGALTNIDWSANDTGLAGSTSYPWRISGRNASGTTGSTMAVNGTFEVTA
jgi:hypothetical protein